MLRLLLLVATFLAGPVFAAEPVALAEGKFTEWSGAEGPEQVFTSGDFTLTLTLSGDSAERIATLKVEKPGVAPVEVSGLGAGTGYGQVAVFPFDEAGGRSVVFGVYSGGAHCCMTFTAVTETADGFVSAEVGTVEGDGGMLTDIDRDGIFEMPLWDDFFFYTFDAFAFSIPTPLIMTSKDGVIIDASTEERFRPFFASLLEEARPHCSGETWDLGGCAGLLAIAARLGAFEEEYATVEAALAAGKRTSGWDEFNICVDRACTSQQHFTEFGPAIRFALEHWGYLPAR